MTMHAAIAYGYTVTAADLEASKRDPLRLVECLTAEVSAALERAHVAALDAMLRPPPPPIPRPSIEWWQDVIEAMWAERPPAVDRWLRGRLIEFYAPRAMKASEFVDKAWIGDLAGMVEVVHHAAAHPPRASALEPPG